MCLGFLVAFLHGEVLDHFSGMFDDGVIFLSDIRMVGSVLFRGVHY